MRLRLYLEVVFQHFVFVTVSIIELSFPWLSPLHSGFQLPIKQNFWNFLSFYPDQINVSFLFNFILSHFHYIVYLTLHQFILSNSFPSATTVYFYQYFSFKLSFLLLSFRKHLLFSAIFALGPFSLQLPLVIMLH